MRKARDWFEAYAVSHQHGVNQAIHFFAVPAILFSIVGLLWQIRLPIAGYENELWCNAGAASAAAALFFYLSMRSISIFMLMIGVLGGACGLAYWVSTLGYGTTEQVVLWSAVFVVSWIFQSIGHGVFEKAKPSFFEDILFLLVGPAWVFAKLLRLPSAKVAKGSQQKK